MQAIHYAVDSGKDVVAHLIRKYKVEPRSKTKVCKILLLVMYLSAYNYSVKGACNDYLKSQGSSINLGDSAGNAWDSNQRAI